MRSEKEIKSKLKQVRYRYLKKSIRKALADYPDNYEHASEIKSEIEQEFNEFLARSSPAEIAYKYPDMAALSWVLDIPVSSFFFKDKAAKSNKSASKESLVEMDTKLGGVLCQKSTPEQIPLIFDNYPHLPEEYLPCINDKSPKTTPTDISDTKAVTPLEELRMVDPELTEETGFDRFWSRFVPSCLFGKSKQTGDER